MARETRYLLLLPLLLCMEARATLIVTYRGDAPNPFNELPFPSDFTLDINVDGIDDYRMHSGGYFVAAMMSLGDNRFIGVDAIPPDLGGMVIPLPYGSVIGPDTSALTGDWRHHTDNRGGSGNGLTFLQYVDAYIGVEFASDAGIHYGWIHYIGFSHPERGLPFQPIPGDLPGGYINAWAWETEPGVAVIAGVVPEPGPGALVLLGAFAFRRVRMGQCPPRHGPRNPIPSDPPASALEEMRKWKSWGQAISTRALPPAASTWRVVAAHTASARGRTRTVARSAMGIWRTRLPE